MRVESDTHCHEPEEVPLTDEETSFYLDLIDGLYGKIYRPSERVLRSIGAAAAAGEFLKLTADLVAPADKPEPPRHTNDDEEPLQDWPIAKAA